MKKYMKETIKKIVISITMLSLILSLTACGDKGVSVEEAKDTVILKVADYDVTLSEYNIYLLQYLSMQQLDPEKITEEDMENIEAAVFSELQLEILEYLLAKETDGIEIKQKDLDDAKNNAKEYVKNIDKHLLDYYGIDEESVEKLLTEQVYINALMDKSRKDLTEEFTKSFTEDYKDTKFHSVYYALFPSCEYGEDGKVKVDEGGNPIELSKDELKKQKENAEELQKRAAKGEKLEDLIAEYGIEAYSGEEKNMDGAHSKELNELVKSMKKGDISDVVETDAGYMIVRMDNTDDKEYKEYVINYAASDKANNTIPQLQQSWITASGLQAPNPDKDKMKNSDIKKMCEKLKKYGIY